MPSDVHERFVNPMADTGDDEDGVVEDLAVDDATPPGDRPRELTFRDLRELENRSKHGAKGGHFDTSKIFHKLHDDATGKQCCARLDDDTVLARTASYAIDPNAPARLGWDVFMLVLVVYSAVVGPYRLAFRADVQGYSDTEKFVDLMFWCDIFLSFFTGYERGYEVVMEKRKIVKNYLGGWFVIDFVATVPWDSVLSVIEATRSTDTVSEYIPSLMDDAHLRILRLLKVLRLLRMRQLVNRLTATWQMNSAYIDALLFFFYVFVVAHLLACIFYLIPAILECDASKQMSLWNPESLAAQALRCTEDPLCDGRAMTIDWYHPRTCMQGSWRQAYGLEEICETAQNEMALSQKLVACQKLAESDLDMNRDVQPWDALVIHPLSAKTPSHGAAVVAWNKWPVFEPFLPTAAIPTYEARVEDANATLTTGSGWVWHEQVKLEGELEDAGYELLIVPESGCKPCMRPIRRYIDALYWSVTTMTTIGYGDRGPKRYTELVFTLIAEVTGLAVFALLLDQITKLADALSEQTQKRKHGKNVVVDYLSSQNLPPALVKETVKFLHFRANSMSGRRFDPEAPEFAMLSPGLKQQIQHQIYLPLLERVHFFGHNDMDKLEGERCQKEFNRIATTGSAGVDKLDKQDMRKFLVYLKVNVNDNEYDQLFSELDRHHSGHIAYGEFHRWCARVQLPPS